MIEKENFGSDQTDILTALQKDGNSKRRIAKTHKDISQFDKFVTFDSEKRRRP